MSKHTPKTIPGVDPWALNAELLEALEELVAEFDTRADELMETRSELLKDTGGIALARAAIAKARDGGYADSTIMPTIKPKPRKNEL